MQSSTRVWLKTFYAIEEIFSHILCLLHLQCAVYPNYKYLTKGLLKSPSAKKKQYFYFVISRRYLIEELQLNIISHDF